MRRQTSRSRRSTARRQALGFLAQVESLEPRHALAVGTAAYSTWAIVGDTDPAAPNDTIIVDRDPANAALLRATVNGVVVGRRLEAKVGTLHVIGGVGNDSITISIPGNTRMKTQLYGNRGDDTITGSDGSDQIYGGPGNDTLNGGKGKDKLSGGADNDSLVGGAGNDSLYGEAGADTLRGGGGKNQLNGGAGIDTFYGVKGTDSARLAKGERLIGNESTNPLHSVDDVDQLKAWYIDTAMKQWGDQLGKDAWDWWSFPLTYDTVSGQGTLSSTSIVASTAVSPGQSGDFSGTNNQVAGVDEGDIVKTDGQHLYVLAGDGVDILNAWPADSLSVVSHITTDGSERALFLHGTRLTVISQEDSWTTLPNQSSRISPWFSDWYGHWQPQVNVTVIDVSAAGQPVVLEKTRLDGWLIDARSIDGRVLVVSQDSLDIPAPVILTIPQPDPVTVEGPQLGIVAPILIDGGPGDGTRYVYETADSYRARLEKAWDDGAVPQFHVTASGDTTTGSLVTAGHAYVPQAPTDNTLLSVSSFNVDDSTAGPDATTSVAGVSGSVYASTSNLYVSATHWGNWWDSTDTGTTTNIYQFSLEDATVDLTAMGAVAGMTLDQFSLDESDDGLLRVATTSGFGTAASSGVFVLAAAAGNLQTIGSVTGLAPGERIYSVRFVGEQGYVSTFLQIDPLFVINLSNPARPRVVGELKVPGFSSYLHPLDATHLLGIGRDVDPTTGRVLGLQLSIFDVSNPATPKRTSTYTFAGEGWQSWSAALWDHHALSWFGEHGILALPVQQGDWWNGNTGLVVFKVDPSSTGGFTNLGQITHDTPVQRSIRIGDLLYSVSAGQVKVHRLDDPTLEMAAVTLTGAQNPTEPWLFTV